MSNRISDIPGVRGLAVLQIKYVPQEQYRRPARASFFGVRAAGCSPPACKMPEARGRRQENSRIKLSVERIAQF